MTEDVRSATLLDALVEGVIRVDAEGRVTGINAAAARLLDLPAEQALGRPLVAVLDAREEWSTASALEPARPEVDTRVRSRGGEQRLVRIRRRPLPEGEVLILEDRTQERMNAHRTTYSERLANGGALAGVRLAPVPDLIERASRATAEEREQACAEVRRRVRDVLQLLTEPWTEARPADLDEVVRWVEAFFTDGARLEVDVPVGLRVTLPVGVLQQVLANVVANGLRAAGTEGRVSLTARADGGWIEVDVVDDGPGPRHPADLLFQPYFSTLPGAQGLGLTVVRELVESSGGGVAMTVAGRSTRVRLRLPSA